MDATSNCKQPLESPAADLPGIVLRQAREGAALQEQFFSDHAARIAACAHAMSAAFDRGGRLFALGNGGSLCEALHASVEFMHPILQKRPALPAIALAADNAILTAIGNDQDFSMIFSQQLQLLGQPGDMVLGITTSGQSANVVRAFKTAREIGLLSIGFAGRDGGRVAELCDFCFVVPSFSIPRIQEIHGALLHILWDLVHIIRGEEDVL